MGLRLIIRLGMYLLMSIPFLITQPLYSRQRGFNELVQAFDVFPRHFNVAIQPTPEVAIPASNLFVFLFRINPSLTPDGYLVERWHLSPDGLEYTFIIREGTVFHDGHPVTASDVVFSIDVMRQYHPLGTQLFGDIESIETIDDTTLVIRLRQPFSALLTALSCPNTPILPKHIYESEDIRLNPANLNAIGSGPFELVWYIAESGFMMKRFEAFMSPVEPYLDRYIGLKCESSQSCLDQIQEGRADLMSFVTNPLTIHATITNSDLFLTKKGYGGIGVTNVLEFNLRRKHLKPLDIRSAIVHSLDKSYIAEEIYMATATPAETLTSIDPPIEEAMYDTGEIKPTDQTNLDAAKRLLEKAILERQSDELYPPITLTWQPDPTGIREKVATYIKNQLRQIGIDIQLVRPKTTVEWLISIRKWEFDMTLKDVTNWGDPLFGTRALLDSAHISHDLWANSSGFNDERIDRLFRMMARRVDNSQMPNHKETLMTIVNEKIPIWAITKANYHTIYNRELINVPEGPWGTINGYNSTYWRDEPLFYDISGTLEPTSDLIPPRESGVDEDDVDLAF